MISLDVLRGVVKEEINVETLPPRYRCHELARIVAPKLKELGCNVEVRSGFVEYDVRSLLSSCYLPFLDFLSLSQEEREQELENAVDGKGTFRVLHSWCEVTEVGCTVIVDLHAYLRVSSELSLNWPLIIEEKSKLSHRYHASGRTFGRWLVIRTRRLPYVTRLRLRDLSHMPTQSELD